MPDIGDAAVGDDRHAEQPGVFRAAIHGGRLRTPAGHRGLRGADRSRPHADAQAIRARANEIVALLFRDDVPADDVYLRIEFFNILNHFDLINRIALRRIHDNHVHADFSEFREALFRFFAGGNRRADAQLLAGVFRGVRIIFIFQQIVAAHQRHKIAVRVHNRQFSLFRRSQKFVRIRQRNALLRGQHFFRHDFR